MTNDFQAFALRLGDFIRRTSTPVSGQATALESEFNALALSLFRLQFERIGPYRELCLARDRPPIRVDHWSGIPCVSAAAFKELELTSLSPDERTAVFHSSGTTGHRPSRHFHSPESLAVYERSLLAPWRHHLLAGLDGPFELLCLTPPLADAPGSSLVHMFDTLGRALRPSAVRFTGRRDSAGSWVVDHASTLRALQEGSTRGAPWVVLGTAFSFVELLDNMPSHVDCRLPAGSRVMETGGYKGRTREVPKSRLHEWIGDRLAVPPSHVVCEYGMSELSTQAYDHVAGRAVEPGGRIFRFPSWARASVVSPETGRPVGNGEAGLIRVLDLANVWSVLAIQTEDVGVRCGDGLQLAGRAGAAEPRGCSLRLS